jgi:hypothetical protein
LVGEFDFDLLSGSIDVIEHHHSILFLVVLQSGISQVIREVIGENRVTLLAAIKVELGGGSGFLLVGQRASEFESGGRHLVIRLIGWFGRSWCTVGWMEWSGHGLVSDKRLHLISILFHLNIPSNDLFHLKIPFKLP